MFPKSKKSQQQDTSDDQSSTALANRGLSLKELEQEMRESRLADRASTFRPTGETAEEKRARKKAVKGERKVISAGNSGFLLLNLSRSYVTFSLATPFFYLQVEKPGGVKEIFLIYIKIKEKKASMSFFFFFFERKKIFI